MKSRKLRALALLLSAIMIITAVPSTLFAFEAVDGEVVGWDQETEAPAEDPAPVDGVDLGFGSDFVAEAEEFVVDAAADEFGDSFAAEDAFVGDTSTPFEKTGTANVGNIVFYYNEAGHADGEVTYIKQTVEGGAASTKLTILPDGTYTEPQAGTAVFVQPYDVSVVAADGTTTVEKKITGFTQNPIDLTDPALDIQDQYLNKEQIQVGHAKFANVKKDCTQFVVIANIDNVIYVSKPFTKYNYTTKKAAEHVWVRTNPLANSSKDYVVRRAATCTEDGEGYIEYECQNPDCPTCEATKTDTVVLKATGHVFKFASYELDDNADWATADKTNSKKGLVESYVPVAKDFTKATYSYIVNYKCDFCDATKQEKVTKPVNAGTLTYANDVNIYEPQTQLTGDYLNPSKMDPNGNDFATLIANLRLVDCTKAGKYDIVFVDKDGNKKTLLHVDVAAHHSPKTAYVTKNGNDYVAIDSKLFDKVTDTAGNVTVYSKVCVPLNYYEACEWCLKLKNDQEQTTSTGPVWKQKYADNHNFGINPDVLTSAKTYQELKKLVDDTNTNAKATVNYPIINATYNPDPETQTTFKCEDGITVTFGYKCPLCGKSTFSEITESVIKNLGFPLTMEVSIDHDWVYTKNEDESLSANCVKAGVIVYDGKCSRCGLTDKRVVPLAALGHDMDTETIYTRIDGDAVLDSVRDRLYKKNGVYGSSIGILDDFKVSVVTGHKCKRCNYIDPIKGETTLTVLDIVAKDIDVLDSAKLDGRITLDVSTKDASGNAVTSTLIDEDGDELVLIRPTIDAEPAQHVYGITNEPTQFVARFGLISIDYQPVTTTTEAPVVPTTEAPVAPTTEAPVAPTTEAPVAPTTEAPVVPTTEAPVVPTTVAPVVEPTTEITTVEPATMPAQVTGEKVTKNSPTTGTIGVKYNAVEGADSYTVNVREPNGAWKKNPTNGAETAYDITGLTEGKCYDIRIAAVAGGIAGPRSGHLYRWLKKVTLMKPTKIKGEAGAVNVTWDAADGASLYKLYVSADKAFKKDVQKIKAAENTAKVTGLKAGTKYYFKVRCYTKAADGKTYTGGWSNVKSKTLK